MLKNFFKIAFRNFFRQRTYTFFNLMGLALGIACGLLLTLHIREELSYEKSFSKHDRIFRVTLGDWSKSSPPLAGEMMKYFPEIKSIARFSDRSHGVINTLFNTQTEGDGFYADSTAIAMFDMKAVAGDAVKALSEPFSVVVTKSMAAKLFGRKDPLQQKIIFGDKEEMWVRAVIADLPGNSHLKFDYLVSMPTFYKYLPAQWLNSRGWMFGWTYVELSKKGDVTAAEKKLKDFFITYEGSFESKQDAEADAGKARLQPLTAIHLHSDLIQEMGPNSSIIYVYIFIAVEILILLIASVNFINLFTTQALKRLKEVGLRKLLGASKRQLVLQFMGEAFILTIMAGLLAILLYQVSLPFYSNLTGRQIRIWEIFRAGNLSILVFIIFVVGTLSGLFPALFISNVQPVGALKALRMPRSSAIYLRKGLVVFQFVVSGLLIISTILIYQQMQLFKNKSMGFDKDQVIVANLYGKLKEKLISNPDVVKNEFLQNPDVLAVGKASNVIGDDLSVESVTPVGAPPDKQFPTVRVMRIDENYLTALNIKIEQGRNFSREFNDSASFIINEKAAAALGFKDPVGKPIINNTMNLQGKVVGVVSDFHFASLHHQIEPLVLEYRPGWTGSMFIKIRGGKIPETVAFLKSKIAAISPNTLFSYGFLDEKIAGLYKKEDNMSGVLKVFAGLAIIISCLGLFGLVAHAAETRTKEIGIRKVIGAGMGSLLGLLSKDLLLLVLLGNLIAWPIAWFAINKWLQEFTYRINIGWMAFVVSAIGMLVIAILTVTYHCLKTAHANPVKSLRTE